MSVLCVSCVCVCIAAAVGPGGKREIQYITEVGV